MKPYYSDGKVSLYLGDCREVLPALGMRFDCCLADPPYQETSLRWDRWQDGWPAVVAERTNSMWCFGSMRMFTTRWAEFADWKLSQDVVWEKQNGSGAANDRFRRVHENALHFYRGDWRDVHHDVPRVEPRYRRGGKVSAPKDRVGHWGNIGDSTYVDDGTRLARSVVYARNLHHRAIHKTEKPPAVLDLLIRYAVPGDCTLLEPFAGSASALYTARALGMGGVGVEADEADEAMIEKAAKRLDQPDLFGGVA